uniref:PNPLA domain-containing protein n=1 Tax=Guillardia theta TaxID=55529 RepID=A0A7S4KW11_GUITH
MSFIPEPPRLGPNIANITAHGVIPVLIPPRPVAHALPEVMVMTTSSVTSTQSGGTQAARTRKELPESISFEGCGAAVSFHLGVYEAVCRLYGRDTLQHRRIRYVGTSSGAIAALVAALGLEAEPWMRRMAHLWEPMGQCCFGLLQVDKYVELALDEILESFGKNAYMHLRDRLFVSVTKFFSRNTMISMWESNNHVKDVILASCFIPVAMLRPVRIGSFFVIDGGFSLNCPRLNPKTCLVSPTRTPGSDVKPKVKARFRDVIGAPSQTRFVELWHSGIESAVDYFSPGSQAAVVHGPALQQTACGKFYYWAMKQKACLMLRISLFWFVLLMQVLCLPCCCVSWFSLQSSDEREREANPLFAPERVPDLHGDGIQPV